MLNYTIANNTPVYQVSEISNERPYWFFMLIENADLDGIVKNSMEFEGNGFAIIDQGIAVGDIDKRFRLFCIVNDEIVDAPASYVKMSPRMKKIADDFIINHPQKFNGTLIYNQLNKGVF